jgi:hypothetical protein
VLTGVAGLLVDLWWWLDTCDDDEVDPDVAVQLQQRVSADVDDLSDDQRRRLLEVLDELAAAERHDGRGYELLFLPFAMGVVDDESDIEQPAVRDRVRPEARTAGPAAPGWARWQPSATSSPPGPHVRRAHRVPSARCTSVRRYGSSPPAVVTARDGLGRAIRPPRHERMPRSAIGRGG